MFDCCPDAELVANLVRAQSTAPLADPNAAAVDLIEQLSAWSRVAAWVEAQRLDVMRRFYEARVDADVRFGEPVDGVDLDASPSAKAARARLRAAVEDEAGRFAAEEIALALNISPTSAAKQLHLAHDSHDVHPLLGQALDRGEVSGFVAHLVATATRRLPDQARRLLDDAVTATATQLPAGKAIDAARNRVLGFDTYADERAERARRDRHVFFRPLDDAMAMLGAIMPIEDGLRAFEHIDAAARSAKQAGRLDTLDQLRCQAFTDALAGGPTNPAGTQHPAQPKLRPSSGPVELQIVMSLTSLLGLDSDPAYIDGYGCIPNTVAARILDTDDVTLRRLLCDPITGAVISTDPTRYRPTAGLRHAIGCRDRHCRLPVCGGRIRRLDHIQARIDAGLTTQTNLQGLSQRCHLAKHPPGWTVTGDADTMISWQTPTGHSYPSLPPPALGHGTGPPARLDHPLHLPTWSSHQQRLGAHLDQHTRVQGHRDSPPQDSPEAA